MRLPRKGEIWLCEGAFDGERNDYRCMEDACIIEDVGARMVLMPVELTGVNKFPGYSIDLASFKEIWKPQTLLVACGWCGEPFEATGDYLCGPCRESQ